MKRSADRIPAAPEPAAVLAKALLRAGQQLGLKQRALAGVIGASPATFSRIANGNRVLEAGSKHWELAAMLVRVYRALAAITGGNVEAMRAWLHTHNRALGAVPAQRLQTVEGLVHVLAYLDAARGRN